MIKNATPAIAIGALAFLEYTALQMGINGLVFASVTAVIGGIAGFDIKRRIGENKKDNEP
tara:strand:- start:204 stop:383 length:180 start_codon:yes stop_codon:yes gene_type:complete